MTYNAEQEAARERDRGTCPTNQLNRKWCFMCEERKPTIGGSSHIGNLFRCADCQPEKKTA